MVGANRIDRAINQCSSDGVTVALTTQWWCDPCIRIKKSDVIVGEVNMVGADVTGDWQALGTRGTYQFNTGRRRDTTNMHLGACCAHQFKHSVQGDGFADYWHPGQTQPRG